MNILFLPENVAWQGIAILGFGAGIVCALLSNKAKRLKRSALIYQFAHDATKEFYLLADEIMSDPATPPSVHDMLYDMTFFVTEDGHGRRIYEHISEAVKSARKPKESDLFKDFESLSKHRLDLYEKVGEAIGIWLFCMAAVHGHSDLKVTTAMVGATDRPKLFGAAEKLLSGLRSGGDGGVNGNGGRAATIGHC